MKSLNQINPDILKIALFGIGAFIIYNDVKKGAQALKDKLTGDSEADRAKAEQNTKIINNAQNASYWSANYASTAPKGKVITFLSYQSRLLACRKIHTAVSWERGTMNLANAEQDIFSVLRSLKNKVQVSQLNTEYKSLYTNDLYYSLKDVLKSDTFAECLTIINQLSDY
jgi:hypothetical protein